MFGRRVLVPSVASVLALSCSGGAGTDAVPPSPVPMIVKGPLCDSLPSGTGPGAPVLLTEEPADVALTWIPVLTTFEAFVRAAGLDTELRSAEAVTILAPTDEAITEVFSEATIDALILFRQDELRGLLEAHLADGALSVSDLIEQGTVTSLAGDRITVTPAAGGMARLDDTAETVCADYRVANARIHVIDGVLGDLPEPAPEEDGPEG